MKFDQMTGVTVSVNSGYKYHRKKDLAGCSNYRMLTLFPRLCNITLHKVKRVVTQKLSEEQ